jgi:lipopolysaccharide export system protein LptC
MADTEDTYDNLTRLLNLGRRKRPRISRRYSYIVRGLRLLLPLLALVIVAVVMAWPKMEDGAITPIPRENIIPKETGRNELLNPHFEGADKDRNPYAITAARAVQSLKDSSIVLLEQPVADVSLSGGGKINARADNGVYRQNSKILVLDGKVAVQNDGGLTIRSDRLNISIDDRITWTDTAVTGDGPSGTLAAKAMNANNATGVVILTGPAKLVLTPSGKGSKQ